ncbi:MAG: 30S ribosomal protein S18 [Erysipelothrix sp.]|nr:30S ribosomal protein S18 [Erysipelothrix sp.]
MGFRKFRPRKKVCHFCKNKVDHVDYKDVDLLRKYVSANGKIIPRRVTGTCAKHQRVLATAIKQSREMALIPYVAE